MSTTPPMDCKGCGRRIQPPRATPGPPGSGRTVIGGWYGFDDDPGPYCPECTRERLRKRTWNAYMKMVEADTPEELNVLTARAIVAEDEYQQALGDRARGIKWAEEVLRKHETQAAETSYRQTDKNS